MSYSREALDQLGGAARYGRLGRSRAARESRRQSRLRGRRARQAAELAVRPLEDGLVRPQRRCPHGQALRVGPAHEKYQRLVVDGVVPGRAQHNLRRDVLGQGGPACRRRQRAGECLVRHAQHAVSLQDSHAGKVAGHHRHGPKRAQQHRGPRPHASPRMARQGLVR